jgi:hypothetical protein
MKLLHAPKVKSEVQSFRKSKLVATNVIGAKVNKSLRTIRKIQ